MRSQIPIPQNDFFGKLLAYHLVKAHRESAAKFQQPKIQMRGLIAKRFPYEYQIFDIPYLKYNRAKNLKFQISTFSTWAGAASTLIRELIKK